MARALPFGPYLLVERIGVGAMGDVHRAVARAGGRVVALKRLTASASTDAEAVAMLRSEAELARLLDHPALRKLVDVGHVDGLHYAAYDYVHGRDLRAIEERALRGDRPAVSSSQRPGVVPPPPPSSSRRVHDGDPVPLDVAVHIVLRVAEALAHAHERRDHEGRPLDLVHRDVSPTNVLVSFEGEVKLLDFGIAHAGRPGSRADAGPIRGTVGYMSPEQVRGEPLDARSDIYSLGVCFWELCAGRRLVDPSQSGEAARVLAGEVPSLVSVVAGMTRELELVLRKALAQNADQRYSTASRFHADLSRQASAEGLLADTSRVARYVRSLFPEAAAEEAASRQEPQDMADNKGGSDLDVFEGLAKKSSRPAAPGLTPPPPSSQLRKNTLLGGVAGTPSAPSAPPPPPAPPPKAGALPSVAPPPKSGTLPGIIAPPGPTTGPSRVPPPPTAPPISPPVAAAPPPAAPALAAPALAAPALAAPALAAPALAAAPPPAAPAIAPPPLAAPPLAAPATLPPVTPLSALAPPAPSAPPKPPTNASSRPPSPPFPPAPSATSAGSLPPVSAPPAKSVAPPSKAAPPAAKTLAPPAPLPPPTPPPKVKISGAASVDMDWDDEEESTHVYDKDEGPPRPKRVGAAAALLSSSGGAARSAPPAPGFSSAPPPPIVPAVPSLSDIGSSRRDDPTAIRARPALGSPSGGRLGIFLGAAALVVALAGLALVLMPKKGALKINVTAKNGGSVGAVDIFIDGVKKCEATPCVVSELEPGPKTIKIIPPGMAPTDSNETVESGKEKVITIPIDATGSTASTTTQAAVAGGGTVLKIGGTDSEKGVHVFVDGTDKGTLPAELRDLTAGSHKVRFEGDRYDKLEQSVDLTAGQVKDLGEIKLKVLKGQVTLDLVTSGVSVTLVRRGDKKTEKKVTDAMLKSPPVRLDIDTSENWRIVATKKGYDDFTQDLTFEDGQADKTVKIELFEVGKPAPHPVGGPAPVAPAQTHDSGDSASAGDKPAASSGGTLNINSIPVSKVILDGKPLGSTPKVGVNVPAGSHTVVFIHPELGKKSVSVKVGAGETKTAAVKFDK